MNREWGVGSRGAMARNRFLLSTSLDSEQELLFDILSCCQPIMFANNKSTPHSPLSTPQVVELSEQEINNLLPVTCYLLPDLQWFSDSDDEDAPGRTEQPTEHKLKRRREEEGQVPKSQELVGALVLFLPALILLFIAPFMFRICIEMIRHFYLRIFELNPTQDGVIMLVFLRYFVILVLPLLAVACFSAIISNVIQTQGFIFTTKPLTPNFSRAVPRLGKFFQRIFSIDGVYNMLKSLVKMAIITGVSYALISSEIRELLNLQKADPWIGFTTVAWIAIKMLIMASLLMLALSIPDIMFQRWRFREKNKMTRYEIKEETKMYEADPNIQHDIRRRFQEMLKQNISAVVPTADVVITNPTHIAVALRWDRVYNDVPKIIAMGAETIAARIREIADENDVPLIENKPLAQSLYKNAKVGDLIPDVFINAVAVIYSKVWQLNEERRRRLSA